MGGSKVGRAPQVEGKMMKTEPSEEELKENGEKRERGAFSMVLRGRMSPQRKECMVFLVCDG